ncbi:hypothetical protein D3C72_1240460 [compost metagenome]
MRKELPLATILSVNSAKVAVPAMNMEASKRAERRFQQMKHSHSAAITSATSGVLEPVASTAANMIAIAGKLNQSIRGRLQVMLRLSQ